MEMSKTKREVKLNYDIAIWDWKEEPYYDLKKILRKFGVYMYDLPACEGTDAYGFLFANKKLTKKQVKEIDNEELGEFEPEVPQLIG